MDDLLHNTPDVAITFSEIEGAELGGCLVVVCVRFELMVVVGMGGETLVRYLGQYN